MLDRRKSLDEAMQRRLLDIAGDVGAIGELAHDVMAPHHSADGSPMLTTQAAAVVAAYRHLASIVEVMAPERRSEVMQNLAAATTTMDPRIVIEMLRAPDEPAAPATVAAGVHQELVARIRRHEGREPAGDDAGDRRAGIGAAGGGLRHDRARRAAQTARPHAGSRPLSETSFGQTDQFTTLWSSMEELLLTYNERPFVGIDYKAGLDSDRRRAEQMARDVAPELAALLHTLDQDNVRRLSVILLIDLLRLEHDPKRAPDVARDVGALAEDLLLVG